jgi:hypothetical protein
MKEFDPIKTTRQVAFYYDKMFEMDTKDVTVKPDFFNFFTGKFHCGKCGEKYSFFHFFHSSQTIGIVKDTN